MSKYFIKEQDNRKSTLKNKFAYFVQFLREGGDTMHSEILGGIPLLILILGALYTRRIIEPACLASVVAVVMRYGTDFVNGYLEKMYQVLSDPSFQLLIIMGIGFTGISALADASGAMAGFRRILERRCKTQHTTIFYTWLLGAVVFIDDYLNALAVSASMKGISDKMRIPREHLAYTVNCMGACVCVMLPFSSWAAFAVGCAGQQGMGMKEYIGAIPFMFYPICAILIALLLAYGLIPKIGELKLAYVRVEAGGSVLASESKEEKEASEKESSALNFVIPMLALIIGMLAFDKNIVMGMLLAIACMLVMYCGQKLMKVTEFFDIFLEGCSGMTPMLITIFVTFIMEKCTEEMGFTDLVTRLMSRTVPASLLPATAFLSVACITFFAASFWTLIVIAFPIFLPMAVTMGVNPSLVIGAVMSGVALGSQTCLYSDAIFMVSAGTGVPNDTQFRVVAPYVLCGVIPASILFIIAGFIL